MVIHTENLTKEYTTYKREEGFTSALKSLFFRKEEIIPALKGISFSAEKGELIGFLGPNGAGKSTSIKILTGVLYPSAGEVQVLGFTPWKERRKYVGKIGAVFGQKSQLIWDIPPVDAFHMNRTIYDIDEKIFNHRLQEMVELLELKDLIKKPTRQLSLGERMKCEFIMAMLHNPEVVFLDEPTIGLDVLAKEKIRAFIKEKNSQGVTFLLTTHDLEDVERLARRVIVINHGNIIFDNSLKNLGAYFGKKKIIKLSTQKPNEDFSLQGVAIKARVSPYEIQLELDLEQQTLNHFIDSINTKYTVVDLSVEELPIEEVIKELYRSKQK